MMKARIRTIEDIMKEKDWEKLVETILAGFQQLDKDLKHEESLKKREQI